MMPRMAPTSRRRLVTAPGIEAFHAQFAGGLEVIGQVALGAPIGRVGVVLLDNKPLHLDPTGFQVLKVDPIIAHEGIGHGDDLAFVGRVGEDLLITGHGGVEHHFACTLAGAGERAPP